MINLPQKFWLFPRVAGTVAKATERVLTPLAHHCLAALMSLRAKIYDSSCI